MKDLSGMVFSRLTVLHLSYKKQRHYYYTCRCECGNIKDVRSDQLINGMAKSCGCLQREVAKSTMAQTMRKHGMNKHPLTGVFNAMKQRCYNPKCKQYPDYGGRGIHICDEWLNNRKSFFEWAIAIGYQDGLTIDRINVNSDYSPSNCRFVSMKEQSRNKRNNVMITYKDKTHSLMEWCDILGLNYFTILRRIKRGWNIEKAFETPIRKS